MERLTRAQACNAGLGFFVAIWPIVVDKAMQLALQYRGKEVTQVKEGTSFRLTPEVKKLIKLLAKNLGVHETTIIELSVREMAERRGVKLEQDTEKS